jgi:hypothetical protein
MTRKQLILYLQKEWDVLEPLPGLSRKSLKELRELVQKLCYQRKIEKELKNREHERLVYDWFVNRRG